jgi:small-conductance mechanosensitive channel
VAGIMLLVYRPFDIGDYIEMGVYHGHIETIRMRDTIVRDREDRLIVIPNTKLITEVVVNNRDRTDRSRHVAAQPPVAPPPENTYDDIKTEVKI